MRPSRRPHARRWSRIAVAACAFSLFGFPAAAAHADNHTCEDVLLSVTPSSSQGDETAVAITAQSLDADTDGWVQVSWAAATGTQLTGVTIRTAEGSSTRTDDLATGTAEHVLELVFCGTTTAAEDDPPSDDPDAQPADEVCDPVLLSVTPTSSQGDEAAAAITAQSLDADADGWSTVSWEAAAGTELTGVTVRTQHGTSTLTDSLRTGTAHDALELVFCGSVAASDGGDTGEGGTGEDDPDDGGEITELEPPDDSSSDDDSSDDPDEESAPPDQDVEEVTREPEPDPATDTEDAEDTEDTDAADTGAEDATDGAAEQDAASADEDTEVLGVQLTQDDDGAGWRLPILLLLVALAGIAATVVIVRNRRPSSVGQGGRR